MPDPSGDGKHAQNEAADTHCLAWQQGCDLDRLLQVPKQTETGGQLDPSQRAGIAPEGVGGISHSN